MAEKGAQVILAPSRPAIAFPRAIFLAGTTVPPDWRNAVIDSLSDHSITIFNPLRLDWASSWIEDESCEPFREQIEWELDMQGRSDVVVIYFRDDTEAPISLLELGLCARSGKALVVCHPKYRKRGNVQIICRRYDIKMLDSLDGLAEAVMDKLAGKGINT